MRVTDDELAAAADAIRDGGLVVYPTETVYGLAADALDTDAVAGVFDAKGRSRDDPLSFAFPDWEDALAYVRVDETEREFMAEFLPARSPWSARSARASPTSSPVVATGWASASPTTRLRWRSSSASPRHGDEREPQRPAERHGPRRPRPGVRRRRRRGAGRRGDGGHREHRRGRRARRDSPSRGRRRHRGGVATAASVASSSRPRTPRGSRRRHTSRRRGVAAAARRGSVRRGARAGRWPSAEW